MPAIRRHVHIAATPRAVWKALTTPEGLTGWLSDDARIEPRSGGRVVLSSVGDDGEPVEERGIIHTWRPTSHLEISWDRIGRAETAGSHVSFQVARDGDEVRLSLVHSGDVLDDDAVREALDTEWKQALSALQESLED